MALLVSGGHTHLLHVRSLGQPIVELGSTVDDAAGEAYDKVARLLGLGYPGGKLLDDLARTGDRDAIVFPRGMTGPRDEPHAFSFSGLKTAVARYVESHPDASTADIAAGFQESVADVLTMKAVRAATELGVSTLLIAGGVAANSRLREFAAQRCEAAGLTPAHPRSAAVHRQRGDDRVLRRAPGGRRCVAVPARCRQRPGPAGGKRPSQLQRRSTSPTLSASTRMYRVLGGNRTIPGVGTRDDDA